MHWSWQKTSWLIVALAYNLLIVSSIPGTSVLGIDHEILFDRSFDVSSYSWQRVYMLASKWLKYWLKRKTSIWENNPINVNIANASNVPPANFTCIGKYFWHNWFSCTHKRAYLKGNVHGLFLITHTYSCRGRLTILLWYLICTNVFWMLLRLKKIFTLHSSQYET